MPSKVSVPHLSSHLMYIATIRAPCWTDPHLHSCGEKCSDSHCCQRHPFTVLSALAFVHQVDFVAVHSSHASHASVITNSCSFTLETSHLEIDIFPSTTFESFAQNEDCFSPLVRKTWVKLSYAHCV